MIELRDNDGWIADLNPEKISAYGVRPAKFSNGQITDHEHFFVVCDSREFTSSLGPSETFQRFRSALSIEQKTVRGPAVDINGKIRPDIAEALEGTVINPHQLPGL